MQRAAVSCANVGASGVTTFPTGAPLTITVRGGDANSRIIQWACRLNW